MYFRAEKGLMHPTASDCSIIPWLSHWGVLFCFSLTSVYPSTVVSWKTIMIFMCYMAFISEDADLRSRSTEKKFLKHVLTLWPFLMHSRYTWQEAWGNRPNTNIKSKI